MIYLIFLLLTITLSAPPVKFLPQRIHIVDKENSNYLIRGNIPITNGEFVMGDLKKQLEKVTGIPIEKQNVIVYSLINHYTDSESKSAMIEQQYFNTHPKDGQIYFYPILGFFFSPGSLPEFMLKIAATYYESVSYDKLDSFVELLKKQLSVGKNKIIYFHCTHGLDRTGLVSGAYKMKYKNQSLTSVMKQNTRLAQRNLKWTAVNGISWFCQQLKLSNPKISCQLSNKYQSEPQTKQL